MKNIFLIVTLSVIITLFFISGCKKEDPFVWEPCEVEDTEKKDECYSSVASVKQVLGFCNRISDENVKKECVAYVKNDPKLCEGIRDVFRKEGCYFSIALNNKDPSLCEKTGDKKPLAFWIDNPAKGYIQKDGCYFFISTKTNNIILCEKIQDKELKEECKRWIKA